LTKPNDRDTFIHASGFFYKTITILVSFTIHSLYTLRLPWQVVGLSIEADLDHPVDLIAANRPRKFGRPIRALTIPLG
jgi:hypothetical protein